MRQITRQLEGILGERGLLEKVIEGYDWRPQQLSMGRAVLDALLGERILLAEAPTGVGKTMAYLVPAALVARRECEPVIVSSYTRTLQDQILQNEAPRLRRLIHPDLRVVCLKGRANYLCRRRWDLFVAEEGSGPDGRWLIERLEGWVRNTQSGDFAEAPDLGGRAGWAMARIGGHSRFCRGRACRADQGCFHKLARKEARQAEVVVVNHSLLLADAFGGGILPDHRAVIVDEAHLLPDAAIDPLTLRISERLVLERVRAIGGAGDPGFSDRVRRLLRRLPSKVAARNLTRRLKPLEERTRVSLETARVFFEILKGHPQFPREGERRRYGLARDPLEAILPPEVDALLESLQALHEEGRALLVDLEREQPASPDAESSEILEAAQGALEDLDEARDGFARLLSPDARERVYYLEAARLEGPSLVAVPLATGPALREHLILPQASVVMTSATLATDGGFDYFAGQVGLEAGEGERLSLSSPFSLDRQILTLIPRHAADPRGGAYVSFLSSTIEQLLRELPRKALILFTAYETLEQVGGALGRARLPEPLELLVQSRSSGRAQLVERFRLARRAALLGTASFWYGVDFPGEELELLVLTRLPFPVPSDPRVEAISEALEETGRSSFDGYALPEALLRFRQGFGRLIRRESDRGVCVILDPRIITARYGEAFRRLLPGEPSIAGSAEELVARAKEWFETGR
ncbi:MAG: helicase C-terminal domain-containing protein [Candidatus Eisenbacteria bacterium]